MASRAEKIAGLVSIIHQASSAEEMFSNLENNMDYYYIVQEPLRNHFLLIYANAMVDSFRTGDTSARENVLSLIQNQILFQLNYLT